MKITVVRHSLHPDSYFIARPSVLGNPFKLKKDEEKGSTIPRYKEHFYQKIADDDVFFIAELNKLIRLAKIDSLKIGCHCAPEPCHGDVIKEFIEKEIKNPTLPQYKVLECSSKGDKRFSALYAKVSIFGVEKTIEEHYQGCKVIENNTDGKVKGKIPDYIVVNGEEYDVKHLSAFYKALWLKYFAKHPELLDFACQFDEFNDIFKGNSINCQADVIRQYVKKGRVSLVDDCKEFFEEIKRRG